jgi:CheY-like chemotaxis protein
MNKNILVIDDEEWFFEPYLDQIHEAGFSFDFCYNASGAIAKIQENNYELIILDICIPPGEHFEDNDNHQKIGLRVFEKIREKNTEIPVICFTVYSDEETVNKVASLNGIHIAKGKDGNALIEKIKELL